MAEEARWVDLLVIGQRRERSLRAMFCCQPIERLLRVAPCAILVTRLNGSQRYRRVVVAVDFSPESRKMVRLAWSLDSEAEVELFRAITPMHEGRLRDADVSEHAIKTYRQESFADARQRMFGLTDSSSARRNRVVSAIGQGDPARQAVVQQQHANAELLVVGKRRSSAVADFFFGSVAQRALRWSTARRAAGAARPAARVESRRGVAHRREDCMSTAREHGRTLTIEAVGLRSCEADWIAMTV